MCMSRHSYSDIVSKSVKALIMLCRTKIYVILVIPLFFNFIDTTDVQDVLAEARNYSTYNYTFTVSCNFIHGSDAKGCIYSSFSRKC